MDDTRVEPPGGMPDEPIAAKEQFTALDVLATVRELRRLRGAGVEKVFDLEPRGYGVLVRGAATGRREIVLDPGRYLAVVERTDRHAEALSPFALQLRRHLTGARLVDVADPLGERLVEITLRRVDLEGPLLLTIELFGQGNLTVARDGKLVVVLHTRRWAQRSVRAGEPYVRPPSRGDPFTMTEPEIAERLRSSRADRGSSLATRIGLGGSIAEEVLARTGLPGGAPATVDPEGSAARIAEAVRSIVGDLGDPPRGYAYYREGQSIDVAPVPLRRWSGAAAVVAKEFPTFSEAAEGYFRDLAVATAPPPDPAARAAREELDRLIASQSRAVEELQSAADAFKADAAAVLLDYAGAERQLIEGAATATDGVVELEVGGRRVRAKAGRPLRDSIQGLYDEAKRLEAKRTGAATALAESRSRLATAASEHAERTAAQATGAGRPRKPNWFERYRWFRSSEGAIVVGGRDAPSNDLLVRRYLKAGDRYVHADVHGAPSVIVKHPPPGQPAVTEATLREAGQWGVAFSRAWRAGLASASAFWVEPDQVSKAGASGEFVAKGAWVIHGERHSLGDLPTELAVGRITIDRAELWMVAPPASFGADGPIQVRLAPDDERTRPEREVELAALLGVSRNVLQSLLPAGGFAYRRV